MSNISNDILIDCIQPKIKNGVVLVEKLTDSEKEFLDTYENAVPLTKNGVIKGWTIIPKCDEYHDEITFGKYLCQMRDVHDPDHYQDNEEDR